MQKNFLALTALLLLNACNQYRSNIEAEQKAAAEQFFRGVWGCNPSDSLVSEDIIISYPVFERLYGTFAIRARENVKVLVNNFCSHWTEAQFTFHEAIAEKDQVVLMWSFNARNTGKINGEPPSNELVSWGGKSVFTFNDQGKIVTEVGEESEPGPFERITGKKN